MAITQNQYTGDGTTVLFTISFPYLEQDHVKASLNGTPTTAFSFANSNTIQFTVAPANGVTILLFRETESGALQNQFFPNSSIPSDSLNNNFTQGLYVAQETDNTSQAAASTANTALVNSTTAISTANAADAKADTAIIDSAAAVSTANTASSNATAAVSTANTASSNASAAVSTANAAASNASAAVSTANAADAKADQALIDSAAAVVTANQADIDATLALSTAIQADIDATSALGASAVAVGDAAAAVVTANLADDKADQAIAAVSAAVLFDLIADVAAIPAAPDDQDFIEVSNSTGIEGFTPLVGLPGGFVGDPGLTVRLVYQDSNNSWNFLSYFANNPEDRYANVVDGATGAGPDKIFFQNDQVVTTSYTIPSGKNASSAGTIEVPVGIDVTVSANSTWVIL